MEPPRVGLTTYAPRQVQLPAFKKTRKRKEDKEALFCVATLGRVTKKPRKCFRYVFGGSIVSWKL